jgi:UDP-glucose 4-epimerase
MISIYIAQAFENNRIAVKGSTDRFRDFIYIDDVVNAFIQTINKLDTNDFLELNICSGVKSTVGSILEIINENFDTDIGIEILDGSIGDQYGIYGSNTKAQGCLDWSPKMELKIGIQKMINWYKKLR